MIEVTTLSLCQSLSVLSKGAERSIVIKYGTLEAKHSMQIRSVELDEKTDKIVIIVE